MQRRCSERSIRHAAVFAGALAVAALASAPARAGFFDFLFGNSQDQAPPPQSYAEPPPPGLGRVAPAPLSPESVRQGDGSTGHVVAYCVRLCDGEHFPLEHMANATPVETCRAMCPASKTKVFFGSEIGSATAKDGAHYADLDTAFVYRKQLVAGCTCNGRNAFGLAPFDLSSDPTLRPGDIVATKDGLESYTGKSGTADAFTPVDPDSVADELNSVTTHVAPHVSARATTHVAARRPGEESLAEEDAGIAPPRPSAPINLDANLRGPLGR
jgi:Protein of unknown function (DUF2865)